MVESTRASAGWGWLLDIRISSEMPRGGQRVEF